MRRGAGWLADGVHAQLPAGGITGSSSQAGMLRIDVQRGATAEDLGRAVARVVVEERAAAAQLVLEVRQPRAARLRVLVVATSHRQRDPVAGRHHEAGRPELDVELDRHAGRQRLDLGRGCDTAATGASAPDRAGGARRAASPVRSACAGRSRP